MEDSSFFQRLKRGLGKSRESLYKNLGSIFQSHRWDKESLDTMEEKLIAADLGAAASEKLIASLRQMFPVNEIDTEQDLGAYLQKALVELLKRPQSPATASPAVQPWIILFLGVNGVGKTTTIGKLAARYREYGKKVLLVAGDTFRAAAVEQLEIWGGRAGADVVKHRAGADPSAVVFDGMQAARSRGIDVVLIDTAGRLHTKTHLVEELKKIRRVIAREQSGAPHETLLVLDATTGQNGLQQARVFKEAADISGIVLTKLDGTAKGGVIVRIQEELGVPVKFIGVGEDLDDLQPFDPARFVAALFEK